jgi:hypothetical protein
MAAPTYYLVDTLRAEKNRDVAALSERITALEAILIRRATSAPDVRDTSAIGWVPADNWRHTED